MAIAATSGALYADLAGRRVGDGSFLGLLEEALGEEAGLQFRRDLRAGRSALILDALDEIHVTSGETAFVAFLTGLCRYLRTSIADGNVVLFARAETSNWVRYVFENEGVGLREFELNYFTRSQSDEYLDRKLDSLYQRAQSPLVHRTHRRPFEAAKASLYQRLANALGYASIDATWEALDGGRLLGYSPVLEGLASFLAVSDHRALDVPVEVGGALREWSLLTSLNIRLLQREQDKFIQNWVDDPTRAMFDSLEALELIYTPAEQCDRLLSLTMLRQPRPDRLVHIPEPLRASYEEAVDSQLANHPFISNSTTFVSPVFQDFAVATMLLDDATGERGREVQSRIRSDKNQMSSGLGPFALALLEERKAALPAGLVDLVLSSLYLRQDSRVRFSCELSIRADEGNLIVDTNIDGVQHNRILVPVDGSSSALRLPERLRDTTVDTDREVEVRGRTIQIGPKVSIEASIASLTADECHIEATDFVTLAADVFITNWDQTVTLRGAKLQVFAEETEGWVQRYAKARPQLAAEDAERDLYRSLRRLLRFFRRTQHVPAGFLAADREQLQVYILRTDERARRLLAALERSGDVTHNGKEYRLNQGFLSGLNMNFSDVESYGTTPELWAYLRSIPR